MILNSHVGRSSTSKRNVEAAIISHLQKLLDGDIDFGGRTCLGNGDLPIDGLKSELSP